MKSAKLWVIVVLMVTTILVLRVRGDVDHVPPSEPLMDMPQNIGSWSSRDIPMEDEVLQVLGKGVFLNRVYDPQDGAAAVNTAPVGLFIGYFPTQRTGQSIHSPQHCLPGSGWVFESSGLTHLTGSGGKVLEVGEYIIANGTDREEVLYWYQSHGRSLASDYAAKLYTLTDSIRYGRTDAALVRIITPVRSGESISVAHQRAVTFGNLLAPMLPNFIPN